MGETNSFYSTLLMISALVSLTVASLVWQRRTAPGGWALVVFLVAMTWWSGTYALHWSGVNRPSKFFWLDATYVGVVTVTPAFLVFVLQFTHRERWLTGPLLTLLIAQPILTLLLLGTDPWHGLFFGGSRNELDNTILSGGPWFWTNVIFIYSLDVLAIVLLAQSLWWGPALYRRQIGSVLLGALIPWGSNMISLAHLNPLPNLDSTPLAFTLSGIIFSLSLFRYRFMDLIPIARHSLIEHMKDGVLVVDTRERVMDVNPAAQKLMGQELTTSLGQSITRWLPNWPEILASSGQQDKIEQKVQVADDLIRCLDIQVIRLSNRQGQARGNLIILRDITNHKQLEEEREDLVNTLKEALAQVKTLRGLLPICAHCKKVRDDQGYWQQIEVYVHQHTEADFSHGICPDCMQKFYPEYYGDG